RYAKLDRYSPRILRHWRQNYPVTCQWLGTERLGAEAREAAMAAAALRREADSGGGGVARVEQWAIPPNPGPTTPEIVEGLERLLRRRWVRRWPADYSELTLDHG